LAASFDALNSALPVSAAKLGRDAGVADDRGGRPAPADGPFVAATLSGKIDFANDKVKLAGAIVPAYGNDLTIASPFIDKNPSLFALAYDIGGAPHAPVLRIDGMAPANPGFLRKLFSFPSDRDKSP
jgi:hypothetical protein